MLRHLLSKWSPARRHSATITSRLASRVMLVCEPLEAREVPSVTLASISEPEIANNKPTYIPVTVTNTPAGTVTTTVSSDSPDVTASVVQGGESIRFDVTGTDSNGVPFSGSMTVELFTDSAPIAAQQVINLVNSGYYNGKLFPRVLNTFVIQGGGTTTSDNSTLPDFQTEFNANYQFNSGGLFAMANSGGSDSNNSQFFITDTNLPLTGGTTNATTGGMNNVESNLETPLNFKYSIVGILTSGFDIYQKIITTTVEDNSATPPEDSVPVNPITITGATVFKDTSDAVIELNPTAGFTGTANIKVTANDGTGPTSETFATTGTADPVVDPPFLGPIANQTTTEGTPVTFTVPVTNVSGVPATIAIRDTATFTTSPTNLTVSIDQTTGQATLTPAAGFTGPIQFEVGVRETSAADTLSSYDTEVVTLTVNPSTTTTTSPPPATSTGTITAVGSAPGTAPTVIIKSADGTVLFTVPVFDQSFMGGVNVVVGDVSGPGTPAVVAVPGPGGGPIIDVISTATGTVARVITLFDPGFRGGLNVAVGDLNNLGYDQVIVGAGDTGGPRVDVLDLIQNQVLLNFFAGNSTTRGGVSLAVGTVFQDQGEMIVAGTGPGVSPTISLYGTTGGTVGSFSAANATNTSATGIQVRLGTLNTTTGVAPIYASPLNSPPGTNETEFDPSQFITFPSSS